ncbi:MAG: hypothetical protein KAR39_12335 [Thermoplasmata archaeon]|nr:hypothetical protein [Thermoplasmata archaeon]
MVDKFEHYSEGLESPASNAMAIIPSDTIDLEQTTRGLYVGSSGNVKVTMAGGQTILFGGLLAGMIYPLRVTRVYLTDTEATGIVGVY